MLNMKGMLAKLFSAVLALGIVIQPVTPLESPIIVFAEGEEVDPNPDTTPAPRSTQDAGEGNMPDPGAGEGNMPDPGAGEGNTPTSTSTPISSMEPVEAPKPLIATYEDGVITISRSEEGNVVNISDFFNNYDLQLKATVTEYTVDGKLNTSTEKTVSFTEDVNNGKASAAITELVVGLVYATISNISISVTPDIPNLSIDKVIDLSALENEELKEIIVDERQTIANFSVSETDGYLFSASVVNPKKGHNYTLGLKNENGVVVTTSDAVECMNPFGTVELSLNSRFAFDTEYTPVIVDNGEEVFSGNTNLSIASPKYTNISWMEDAPKGQKYAEVVFDKEVYGNVTLTLNQTANGETKPFEITGVPNEKSTVPYSYLFELTDVSDDDSKESYGAGTTYSFYDEDKTTPVVKVNLSVYDGYNYEVARTADAVIASSESLIDTVVPELINVQPTVGDTAITNNEVSFEFTFSEPVALDKTDNLYTVTTASGEPANEDTPASLTSKDGSQHSQVYTATFSGNSTDLTGLVYKLGSFTVTDVHGLPGKADITTFITNPFTIDKVSPTVTIDDVGNLNDEDGFVKDNINFVVSIDETLDGELTVSYTYKKDGQLYPNTIKNFKSNENGDYEIVLGDEADRTVVEYSEITLSGKDAAGNEIKVNGDVLTNKIITVDNAGPEIEFSDLKVYNDSGNEIDNEDNIANGKAVYTVKISDSGSGIDTNGFVFKIDDAVVPPSDYGIKELEAGTYTITLSAPAKADQKVTLSASDSVGNIAESSYRAPFIIENEAPVIKLNANGESTEDLKTAKQSHVVSFDVTDYTMDGTDKSLSSNLYSVKYWLTKDGTPVEFNNGTEVVSSAGIKYPLGDATDVLSGNITIQSSDNNALNGRYVLHIKATDKALNSNEFMLDVVFDNTAPELIISHAEGEEGKALRDHTFTYKVEETTDDNSGIVSITYALYDSEDPATRQPVQIKDYEGTYKNSITLQMADATLHEGSITIVGHEEGHQISGKKYLIVTAVDTARNITEEKTLEMLFDNTKPKVDSVTADNENATRNHTFTVKASDFPVDAASGVSTISFTVKDAEGVEIPIAFGEDAEKKKTSTFTYDASLDDDSGNTFVIDGEKNNLNGVYTVEVVATDAVDYESDTYSVKNVKFDNTAPEIVAFTIDNESPEQTHTFTLEATDYPEAAPSGVASITYILTDTNNEAVKIKQSETAEALKENEVKYNADGSATTFVIDGNLNNLDGVYTLSAIVTDTVGYTSASMDIAEVKFDTTPLEVDISIATEGKLSFYEGESTESGNAEVYSNDEVTVTVTAEDNFPITNAGEDGNLFVTAEGIVTGDKYLTVKDGDKNVADVTLTYGVEGQNTADVIEIIRNVLKYSGIDAANNGANVTVQYIDSTSETSVKTLSGNVLDPNTTEYTVPYQTVVDMVAPEYTMDITNPDVADSVYNNRVYYGLATKDKMAPTVTIDEGNFYAEDYQIATLYSDGGNENYETADVGIDSISWENVAGREINAFVTEINGVVRPDGVYRFAVRGTDKAGNELVKSVVESNKDTEEPEKASILIPDTAETNDYWTNVKVVDTQISVKLEIMRNNGSSAYLTYEKDNIGRTNVNIMNPRDLYRQENEAYVKANAVDEKSQYRIEFSVDSTIASYPVFGADQRFGRAEVTTGSYIAGNQRFNVSNGYIVDRAGNRVELSDIVGNYVYLDTTPPVSSDIDRPTASIKAKATSDITARTPDGRDLYAEDVTLTFTITDPNQSEAKPTSSGLREVHYVVTADGVRIEANSADISEFEKTPAYTWTRSTTVGADTNNISVELWGIDNSGNESNHATYEFGIDKTAPVITVTYDNNDASHDKYFKANRTATVTIQDRNIDFSKINVETSVGHSGLSAATANGGGVGNNDTRTFTIPYTEDGDYTLEISGTDAVGNQATVNYEGTAPRAFTIDKTAPVINVSFNNNDVRNGKYYNAGRVATVTIDEHNFLADEVTIDQTASIQRGSTGAPSPSGFGTSGDTHSATINYAADGNYTLTVSYTDMAGNEAEQVVVPEFTIDTTKPVVRFDENTVTDNMATNGVIAPSVIFDDTNFDANGINVTLTGARVSNHNHPFTRTVTQFGSVVSFSDFARVKESDDIYTAKATITDLAGNTAEATVRFSVNRFGSTFDFNEDAPTMDLVDNYYAQETENVIIREVNVNRLTGYTLTVNRDGSNITLVEGEDFRVISSSIAGGYQYIYEIFPDVFSSEGTYSIIVQSVDEAGNTNTNSTVRTDDGVNDYPVVFAIDKTLPTVSIDELDAEDRSNNNFNENTKTFRISVRDNNAMSRVVVTVDGNVVFDMDGQELAEYLEEHGGFVEITLDAASGYQTIKVQAFDGAGNESADTQYQVLVTTNFFVRFFYNKPLFYGSIIFLILLLLAIAYYIKKRMDKQKKNA